MPTPHHAPPVSVNPPVAALTSLPEEVSSVVELHHLHAPVAKMERVPPPTSPTTTSPV
jgi:hypothetical protein